MRLAVDAPSLGDTEVAYERANQSAAAVHTTLAQRLARCGGLAGDSAVAADFAAAYDDAAQLALDAVADLVEAFATCGRLTGVCAANHLRAEARSVISGTTVYNGSAPVRGYVSVLPTSVPASLGSDSPTIPSWAGWILDQVEGFVWPDADVDRLRAAGTAWRAASSSAADLAARCASAIDFLSLSTSPEIPLATDVTERLAHHCQSVSAQCATLADACSDYADHVEAARAEILDLVHDLLRDAVVIQGIGIVLGLVTGGTTAAAAAALNASKIAAAAPRLLRIVSALRSLASSCAMSVRVSVIALRDVRRDLVVFRRARATLVSTYDAERVARVARLSEIARKPGLLNPRDLRGLSRQQVDDILRGWERVPAAKGQSSGWIYKCPDNYGRRIRVMDGYPTGTREDPITWGPYVRISQNGVKIRIPLEGNPTL